MGSTSPIGSGNFEGRKEWLIVNYGDILRSSVQKRLNRSRCHLGCGLGLARGIMYYMGVQVPHGKEQFCRGKGWTTVNYKDALP